MKAAGPLGMSHGYFGLFLQVEVLCNCLDKPITSISIFFFKENTRDYSKEKCPSSIYFLNCKTTGGAAERGY